MVLGLFLLSALWFMDQWHRLVRSSPLSIQEDWRALSNQTWGDVLCWQAGSGGAHQREDENLTVTDSDCPALLLIWGSISSLENWRGAEMLRGILIAWFLCLASAPQSGLKQLLGLSLTIHPGHTLVWIGTGTAQERKKAERGS